MPARICWLGYGERDKAGLAFNELVAKGVVKAPIVIGRDHLDSGSVASPYRETGAMKDGSDAIADWPLLKALLNTASGATWVLLHYGVGVGSATPSTPGRCGSAMNCAATSELALLRLPYHGIRVSNHRRYIGSISHHTDCATGIRIIVIRLAENGLGCIIYIHADRIP